MQRFPSLVTRLAWLLVLSLPWAHAEAADNPEFVVTTDRASGVYETGDTVTWKIEFIGDKTPETISYKVLRGGMTEIGAGTASLKSGPASISAKFEQPGALLLRVEAANVKGAGGAVASPGHIKPSAPRPDDFDAFWEAQLKRIEAIAPNPKLEAVDVGKPEVDYWKITLDDIGERKIRGQLARPMAPGKLPALLIVQWAGVYPLQRNWAIDRAAEGWLVLNTLAHDLPIDEPAEFYNAKRDGELKDYPSIGNESRETAYFLPMYLACYQAARYLTERDDWDGKTLVVMGGSQGGLQALVTAAIFPKVTAALAAVPAGCDMLGPDMGRQAGWPQWYWSTGDKDKAKVRQASRYFDVVNFAPKIQCPVLISAGLADDVCPPEGILAAVNQMTCPKETILLPGAGHQEIRGSHDPYDNRCWGVWLPALLKGEPPPPGRH